MQRTVGTFQHIGQLSSREECEVRHSVVADVTPMTFHMSTWTKTSESLLHFLSYTHASLNTDCSSSSHMSTYPSLNQVPSGKIH